MNETFNMDIDENLFENNPIMQRAKELTDEDNQKAEPLVQEILALIMDKKQNEGITSKHLFLSLGKSLIYLAQSLCKDEEDFFSNLDASNRLVIRNIFPALGAYAHDEMINKQSIVEFKGEFDEENFSFKRLMMVAGAIVDYSYWKNNYNLAITEHIEEEEKIENESKQ